MTEDGLYKFMKAETEPVNNKRRILIYAHYYFPDVASTGQILQDLAEGLADEYDVRVICTVPSYTGEIHEQYRERKLYRETRNGVRIVRVPVPAFSKGDKLSRVRNILSYYTMAKRATREIGPIDCIVAVSQPPLLGGMLGVYGKRRARTERGTAPQLIYCIQDFNPEQVMAVGYFKNRMAMKSLMAIDKHSCRRSDLIVTVGCDLVKTMERRFCGARMPTTIMINNWIDETRIHPLDASHPRVLAFKRRYNLENKFVIMYSGNIGLYYDLENLIKVIGKIGAVKTKDGRNVAFAFVGGGSVLDLLKQYQREQGLENVTFIPYQDKDELIYSLNAGDVHWCVNAKGIKGVSCPSKYYGLAAVGKPILGVLEKGTEIRMLIEKTRGGLVSEPEDYATIERNLMWFIEHANDEEIVEMGARSRAYLLKNFTKAISIGKYKHAIESLMELRNEGAPAEAEGGHETMLTDAIQKRGGGALLSLLTDDIPEAFRTSDPLAQLACSDAAETDAAEDGRKTAESFDEEAA